MARNFSITARASACALFLLAAFPAACTKDSTSANTNTTEVTLGGIFSLTGNWATLGATSKAAMELAVEDVNASLSTGTSGFHFKTSIIDTKLDPALALTALQTLKSQGVEVVIGPQSSAELANIKALANSDSILVISQSSTAGSLAIAGDNVFRLTPGDSLESVALVGLIEADSISALIPFWRNDAGNNGLAAQTRARFTAHGGTVSAGDQYSATETSFASHLATIKAQVQEAIGRVGKKKVAVSLAAFDEAAQILALADADSVLSSVKWYGTDGTAGSDVLKASAGTVSFANKVGYANPIFGLEDAASDKWAPIAARIQARAGIVPDAFALAVYDAVWLAADAYLATGNIGKRTVLKQQLVTAANSFYGATGFTALNAAGDRKYGNFDFLALKKVTPTSPVAWVRVAQFDTQTGSVRRFVF